ncbi:hypothetical protein H0H92_000651 [Tricholoma furcatifolium]|nr:hypothetical protein H0H92_000651 [Tricholoma furcatifolium]
MTESNRTSSFMQSGDVMRRHASTHSWVISNQQNPPPPPPEDLPSPVRTPRPPSEALPSPMRGPRPLPEPVPSPARLPRPLPDPQRQIQYQNPLRPKNVVGPEDEEEYMNVDPSFPGMDTENLGQGLTSVTMVESPTRAEMTSVTDRSFVAGFVAGLRRLPRVVLGYRNFGDKRKYFRKVTYGSGGTFTNATDLTSGNTLPLYTTQPSTPIAGPSQHRHAEPIAMPVPQPAEAEERPVIVGPSLSQRRRNPSLRVTAPSEEGHEHPDSAHPPPALAAPLRNSNPVTVYNLPGQEEYTSEDPPALPNPVAGPVPDSQQPVQSPAASVHNALPQSPVLARPPPTCDYRKMTLSSSPLSPRTLMTSLGSEPSFSSELNPVKRFFVRLYRMPWIAPERVTIDYRPTGTGRRRRVSSSIRKPGRSWYRGKPGVVLTMKGEGGDLDLLSPGASRRTSANTPSSALASPALETRHRRSSHRRSDRRSGNQEHRSRHRRNTTSTTNQISPFPPQGSPMIPAVYPYPFPYPFTYQTFSTPSPLREEFQPTQVPRGPRPHRTPTYPHGYVPYQPQQPPVFVMPSPAHTTASTDASNPQAQVMSPVFVPMSLVPGAFPSHQEPVYPASSPRASTPIPGDTGNGAGDA